MQQTLSNGSESNQQNENQNHKDVTMTTTTIEQSQQKNTVSYADIRAAEAERLNEAQALVTAGISLREAGDEDGAQAHFRQAHGIVSRVGRAYGKRLDREHEDIDTIAMAQPPVEQTLGDFAIEGQSNEFIQGMGALKAFVETQANEHDTAAAAIAEQASACQTRREVNRLFGELKALNKASGRNYPAVFDVLRAKDEELLRIVDAIVAGLGATLARDPAQAKADVQEAERVYGGRLQGPAQEVFARCRTLFQNPVSDPEVIEKYRAKALAAVETSKQDFARGQQEFRDAEFACGIRFVPEWALLMQNRPAAVPQASVVAPAAASNLRGPLAVLVAQKAAVAAIEARLAAKDAFEAERLIRAFERQFSVSGLYAKELAALQAAPEVAAAVPQESATAAEERSEGAEPIAAPAVAEEPATVASQPQPAVAGDALAKTLRVALIVAKQGHVDQATSMLLKFAEQSGEDVTDALLQVAGA